MTTVKISWDKRRIKSNGKYPIRLCINHQKHFYVQSGLEASEEEFNGSLFVKSLEKNMELGEKIDKVRKLINSLKSNGVLQSLDDNQLKKRILEEFSEKTFIKPFLLVFDEYTATIKKENTLDVYAQTRAKIANFDANVNLATLNYDWLIRFEASIGNLSLNSRSIHMRNIRTVFNYAIDQEYTTAYPFRRFHIKQRPGKHRTLTIEQLCQIIKCTPDEWQVKYRDIFMLSFYLLGINLSDLVGNPKTKIVGNRLEYYRNKTGKYYSIKIEPEAMVLLSRYPDILNSAANEKEVHVLTKAINRGLKLLSSCKRKVKGRGGRYERDVICPELSYYYARHTWSTIAAFLEISKETIGAALGHSDNTVTDVYIAFDRNKVDQANRKVIDYVNQNL